MHEHFLYASLCANAILFLILIFSIRYNYKFGILILGVQDAVEKSLDVLDGNYSKISEIVEIPVFFDSIEVRQVMSEIQRARRSILGIAELLTEIDNDA
jgi:hypothetical protein|tara:strand:+ start:43358 stop:43654 length:297 start_codon:yes stop_codon:yes gene_type:complete